MTAQEWLAEYERTGLLPPTRVTADIIRAQQAEIDRLTTALAEKEGECERLRDVMADSNDTLLREFDSNAVGSIDLYTWIKCQVTKIKRLESLADSRLADQEAIEKKVAGICADIITEWPYRCVAGAEAIRKKYGVE